jgi:hypothetical protein
MRSAAKRMQAYRARTRNGQAVLRVSVDLASVEDALIADKFLLEQDRDDRRKVEAALEKMIKIFEIDALKRFAGYA